MSNILLPVTKKFIVIEREIYVPDNIETFDGNILECFNCGPWGNGYSENAQRLYFCKAGDVIEMEMTFATTHFNSQTYNLGDTVLTDQEYLSISARPDIWSIDEDGNPQAPAFGVGGEAIVQDPWGRDMMVFGEVDYGISVSAIQSQAYQSQYPELDDVKYNEAINKPNEILTLKNTLTVHEDSFQDYLDYYSYRVPPPTWDDYKYALFISADNTFFRGRLDFDCVTWIYNISCKYNGVSVDKYDGDNVGWYFGGSIDVSLENEVSDNTLFNIGNEEFGKKIISNKYKYEPWKRYPTL